MTRYLVGIRAGLVSQYRQVVRRPYMKKRHGEGPWVVTVESDNLDCLKD